MGANARQKIARRSPEDRQNIASLNHYDPISWGPNRRSFLALECGRAVLESRREDRRPKAVKTAHVQGVGGDPRDMRWDGPLTGISFVYKRRACNGHFLVQTSSLKSTLPLLSTISYTDNIKPHQFLHYFHTLPTPV